MANAGPDGVPLASDETEPAAPTDLGLLRAGRCAPGGVFLQDIGIASLKT
jgi:hypothetical protein